MQRLDFNRQWKFYKEGKYSVDTVDLPHDAMILEERQPDSPSGSAGAFFPGGIYRYSKEFEVPANWKEKHIEFVFEGVYQNARVSINGKEAGGCAYGYTEFTLSADEFLNYGEKNFIEVTVDNSEQPNSRWYTGSGIYRPVWMYVGAKEHIVYGGVKIITLSVDPAKIRVETGHTGGGSVEVELLYHGKKIAEGRGDVTEFIIPQAHLWSDDSPELYECRVSLNENGEKVDEVIEQFGIRKVEWSPKGLFINGKKTLLRGGCIHHDNGILGARCYREAEERRVRILKKAGYNAIRSAHNPVSRAMLESCDRLGMYVMDETWDMWYRRKSAHDYAEKFPEHYKEDIEAMIRKDQLHPSVIMYSIGNEVSEPAEEKGIQLAKEMADLFHRLDPTRPVSGGFNLTIIANAAKGKTVYKEDGGRDDSGEKKTAGMNSTMFNMVASVVGTGMNKAANGKQADQATAPVLDTLDIAGYNYASGRYVKDGKLHPGRLIFGSETFPQDIAKNWKMVKQYPYLIGDFMWTAWDYLGEAGIGAWSYHQDAKGFEKPYPWLLADTGAFDILGNPNGEAFWAKAVWGQTKKPLMAVRPLNSFGGKLVKAVWRGTNAIPSWSFKDCEGQKAVVEVYTDAPIVKLYFDGKQIGKKKTKDCRAVFKVKYIPGTLTAVAFDDAGEEKGSCRLTSAEGESRIRIRPEKTEIEAGEVLYVNIDITGENGVIKCNEDRKLNVKVEGGELLAFGSANPRTEERFDQGSYTTWYGRALAVVRSKNAGSFRIIVSGVGMETQREDIHVKKRQEERYV